LGEAGVTAGPQCDDAIRLRIASTDGSDQEIEASLSSNPDQAQPQRVQVTPKGVVMSFEPPQGNTGALRLTGEDGFAVRLEPLPCSS
jgi:hypothetical protein